MAYQTANSIDYLRPYFSNFWKPSKDLFLNKRCILKTLDRNLIIERLTPVN